MTREWHGGGPVDFSPNFLVLIAGPFTMASMYVFTLVIGWMNARRLPAALATPAWIRWGLLWATVLWGWFTAEELSRIGLRAIGAPGAVAESISLHWLRVVL